VVGCRDPFCVSNWDRLFVFKVSFTMSRSRNYLFTVNFADAEVTALTPEEDGWATNYGVRFAAWQLELGENGTMHYQGYIVFGESKTISAARKTPGLESCHMDVRRGTAAQAYAYVTKEDTRIDGPWTFGVREKNVISVGH